MKQASELHTEPNGDAVTVCYCYRAEVNAMTHYLIRSVWRHTDELGWHHEFVALVPKADEVLEARAFLFLF